MGAWYWIGVNAGLGAAVGVLLSVFAGIRWNWITVIVVGVGCGVAGRFTSWDEAGAGGGGALLAGLGVAPIVLGALRRGGTRGGVGVFVAGAALVAAGVAFIPAAGYLLPVALIAFSLRVRRRTPERYAGLRTLAKD